MEHQIVPTTQEYQLEMSSETQSLSCTVCSFFNAEFTASDAEERSKSASKLCLLIICYFIVMAIEIAAGVIANSLAVLTDAAHLLSDIFGFSISLFTVWASGWGATSQRSFGFHRLEVLGTFVSVQLIWLTSGTLIYAAVSRMLHKNEAVNGKVMLIVATIGFVINLILVLWLGHGHHHSRGHSHHHSRGHSHHHSPGHNQHQSHDHIDGHSHSHTHNHSHDGRHNDLDHTHSNDHNEETGSDNNGFDELTQEELTSPANSSVKLNINIQGAYMHVITDMIQTPGVMIAGVIIWVKPNWLVADLICTLFFAVLALSTTIPMLRDIYNILLESTPREIDVDRLKNDLQSMEGIKDVHDMHVWTLTVGKTVLACHVIAEAGVGLNEIIHKLTDYCKTTYGIHHVTIQIEEE